MRSKMRCKLGAFGSRQVTKAEMHKTYVSLNNIKISQMYPMYADQIVSLSMFLGAIGLGGCEVETHNLIIKSQSPCNTNNHATLRSVPPFPELHSLLVFGACIRLI